MKQHHLAKGIRKQTIQRDGRRDIEHGNPVFPGRFHADVNAVILAKPFGKFAQAFGESGKPCFVVNGTIVLVSDPNAGKNPGFVYVETAAVGKKNFEHGVPPASELQSRQGLVIRKIESISKR